MKTEGSQILRKAISVLDCFSTETPKLGVREVARTLGISSSASGRVMQSLRDMGLLIQDPSTQQYSLGSRVLTWAGVYSATLDIRNISFPYIQELYYATQETISLYVLEGKERVCVERLESQQNVRIVARIGRRLPLYAGSAGKVFLAYLPPARCNEILASTDLIPLTSRTITDKEVLIAELHNIRKNGYAESYGEWLLDASGVAAPIFDEGGSIVAALTISGPSQRFTKVKVKEYGQRVYKTASEISREMGYRIPVGKQANNQLR
jgi:IclR family transcriptional regulator, KDG regulon repressor